MDARRDAPSAADLATEANGLATGLGMLSMIYFPFALPALLLALPLVLPLIPLALLAGLGYLLFRLLVLPVRLVRSARQRRAERHEIALVGHLTPGGIPAPRR